MQRISGKSLARIALPGIIIFSMLIVWFVPFVNKQVPAPVFRGWFDSLAEPVPNPDSTFIQAQAEALSRSVYHDSRASAFAAKLVSTYNQTAGSDVVLVYTPGGLGGAPIEQDTEWPGVLAGIADDLMSNFGLSSVVIQDIRGSYFPLGFLKTIEETFTRYPETSAELAVRVAFIARYRPNVLVFVTGRSNGAVFVDQAMRLLLDNERVYSIQAGRPTDMGKTQNYPRNLLVINQDPPDTLSYHDWWAIIKANFGKLPASTPPEGGAIQILKWYLRVPGHVYAWDNLYLRTQILDFVNSQMQNRPGLDG